VTTPTGVPVLAETTKMVAAYLTAERGLGRVAIQTDVDTLAVILVGGAHLLAAGSQRGPLTPDDLHDIVSITLQSVGQRQPDRARADLSAPA
jgi:hypothetical protein